MRKAEADVKLAEVKLALARKCDRLAKTAHSTPKRKTLMHHAQGFRRQAANLTRQ